MEEKFTFVALLHLIILLIAWSSPFWVPYYFVIIVILLYWAQLIVFGDCLLTKKQFEGTNNASFNHYLLSLIGININLEKTNFLATYILPLIIAIIAVAWQIILPLL